MRSRFALSALLFAQVLALLLLGCVPGAQARSPEPGTAQDAPLIPLLSPRTTRDDPRQMVRQGREAARCGDRDQAWELLTRAVNSTDMDQRSLADALVLRGSLGLGGVAPYQALADFRRAVELAPATSGALAWRALAWLELGRTGPALDDARRAVTLTPSVALAHLALGRALLAQERPGEARDALDEAVRLDPGLGAALHDRALALRALGDPEAAGRDESRARELSPVLPLPGS
ncbi:tetratricopeptide repeat protein [Desulfocurvus sp.]|uniref:tetratricopeptide repeat protein n=1 Tax=Desulfocurvus sp. TaxID=2871698 RepID=UPI0025C051A3|nr:tetratricopeptide repeat protein [Desulfocurvus sp.]